MIRIAFTKGRIEAKAIEILEKAGYNCEELKNKGRKLFFRVGEDIEVVLAKAGDVITYVEHGVCDAGIVGKDTIMESGGGFYEVLDLGFGKCRFALAAKKGSDFFGGFSHKVVASKYPKVAKDYFSSLGMDVEIVKIDGSVELAPLLGLADGIVDIVETGSTLKENGLEVVAEVAPVSARFIVNAASMKLKKAELDSLIENIENAL
ncbi:MAG: ATP phosphoribosyltransferase [Eubacteriales bacterium]